MYSDESERVHSRKRIPKLPNPFPPNDIYSLVETLSTVGGLATVAYKLLKLWIKDRKARKIIVKKGDLEIEIKVV